MIIVRLFHGAWSTKIVFDHAIRSVFKGIIKQSYNKREEETRKKQFVGFQRHEKVSIYIIVVLVDNCNNTCKI